MATTKFAKPTPMVNQRYAIACRTAPRYQTVRACSKGWDVKTTPEGEAFAKADISARKSLFREAALGHIALLQKMKSALESKSDHVMPLEFFHDILDEHFTESEVERQIETALNWGRYAEIFSYDPESGTMRPHQANERTNEDITAHR